MGWIYFANLVVVFILGFQNANANVEMSLSVPDESKKIGQTLPDISFFNEENKKLTLQSLPQDKAFLLVPFYTHCTSACPLNVSHLKDVLKTSSAKDYQVILFSFNPNDTSQDLKDFRKALQVPKGWLTLRASSKDTNTILEALDFRYMTQGADFVHSNTLVVLSPKFKISKFIQGLSYTTKFLDASVREAKGIKNKIIVVLPFILVGISLLSLGRPYFRFKPKT